MTTIVIGLAAVVVLIFVVVLLALRYLKASEDVDDFEDMPEDRSQPRGTADQRDRHVAIHQPARGVSPPPPSQAEPRRAADRGPRTARDADRAGRYDPRDLVDDRAGQRDDRAGQRAAAKYDDRRGGDAVQGRQDSLPAVRPRPARGKRAEDGDWPSTKWDQLSDVDYWAEVASDKPLTTTAQPAAQSRPARAAQARAADARQGGGADARQGGGAATLPERTAAPRLPVRGARQPAAAALPSASARGAEFSPAPHVTSPVTARAHPDSAKRPAAALGGETGLSAPGRRDSMPPGPARPAALYDDDPLTSPSFPKIPAADSRSYGGGRGDTPPSGTRTPDPRAAAPQAPVPYAAAPHAAATQQFATYGSPSGQFDSYGAAGRQPAAPAGGFGQPGSLQADHATPPPYRPLPPLPGPGSYGGRSGQAGMPAGSAGSGSYPSTANLPPSGAPPFPVSSQDAPSGNPYGSYVSSSPSGYQPSSPAGPPDSGLSAGYGGQVADSGGQREIPYSPPGVHGDASAAVGGPVSGWYPELPAPVVPASAYLDVTQQLSSLGIPAGGYLNGNGHADRAAYPGGQHDPAGYLPPGYPAAPGDPGGYAGPDPYGRDPYGGDPYGGYPGYGAADR